MYGIACFRDLAVDLRLKLGDWFRVVQLLKTGGGGGKYAWGGVLASLRNQALHVTERFEDKETRMFLVSFSHLGSLSYRKKTQHSSVER